MTPDPLPLHVHEAPGGRDRPPLLLVHGFAASSFSWRHWIPELAETHHVLAVDLKGFGQAPTPRDRAYSPVDHATLVRRLVVERDLRGVTLVGHSLGGGVALIAALKLLEDRVLRLRRLVLVAAAGLPQRVPLFLRLLRLPLVGSLGVRVAPAERVARAVLRRCYHDRSRITDEQVLGYAAPFRPGRSRHGLLETARRIVPDNLPRLVDRYREIDVPSLLVWGRQDRIVPCVMGEALAEALPEARLATLERCGHIPAEERPRESLAFVREFLGGS